MKQRILEIAKLKGLSHISSCISALPIYEEICQIKKPEDKLLVSGAHSHLAHLVVREKYEGLKNIEDLIDLDIHCNKASGCDFNGGSLGHAIGIGIGMALVDKNRDVYVIITDGSFAEGSEMEALRIARQLNLSNLKVYANFNGFSAVERVDMDYYERVISAIGFPVRIFRTSNEEFDGVKGHYETIKSI